MMNHLEADLNDNQDIAIIGISGRYPGANDIEQFWQNIRDGVESLSVFSEQELRNSGIEQELLNNSNYVRSGSVISNISMFDASFFGYSPKQAEEIDPQQRLFLECAWEVIEKGGYSPHTYQGSIGVYAGISMSSYFWNNVNPSFDFSHLSSGSFQQLLANDKDYLATRVAYNLGLTGPAITIQTACSTSLVAAHLACQSILNGECDMALAGGVSIRVPQEVGYLYQDGMILSPDGHCRAFDAKAEGTRYGNGLGVVLLKGLEDAIADKDYIYAVIKGSAINNDGSLKVGYTAPSVVGQAAVISEAQAVSGVEAETISYIETHGTGTQLGDPIEVEALTKAFRQSTEKQRFCALGSVKTNVGHLDAAAGVTGLIKATLALQHKLIPPSLNFEQPNPKIDFTNSPFYVNTSLSEWKSNGTSRRAGVSSFAVGGTNAHVILEEAPKQFKNQDRCQRPLHLLTLSAKTKAALVELVNRYQNYIQTHQKLELADICYTANSGRVHFNHRLAIIAADQQQLATKLSNLAAGEEVAGVFQKEFSTDSSVPQLAFLFTGQGSQYLNMGRQLYETQPTFRDALEECDEILSSLLDQSLLAILYHQTTNDSGSSLLDQTAYTQPVLFAIEYALFKLWQSWGIKPDVVMGHSVGEYVAATVAGVFSLEDGLRLIAKRGQLMQQLPSLGEMVSVIASESKVQAAIASYTEKLGLAQSNVGIAAINGPESVVISGASAAVKAISSRLESEGVKIKRLQVSHAFHSPLMTPILAKFEAVAQQVSYHEPQIPIISNVTGEQATCDISTPDYWVNHICQPVQFFQSMETLYQQGYEVFLEIGPKPILLGMGRQCLPEGVGVWLPSLRPGVEDWQQMLSSLGQLYLQGVEIDWLGVDQDYGFQKVVLPTYPFQRQRYWIEPSQGRGKDKAKQNLSISTSSPVTELLDRGDYKQLTAMLTGNGSLTAVEVVQQLIHHHQQSLTQAALNDCLYHIEWQLKPSTLAPETPSQNGQWLIIGGEATVAQKLAEQLEQKQQSCYVVQQFPQNYSQLLHQVQQETELPLVGIVYLTSEEVPSQINTTSSQSLLGLLQTLLQDDSSNPVKVWVVTAGAVAKGEHFISVNQTPLWGMGKVVSLEHPELWGGLIDIEPGKTENHLECLLRELLNRDAEDQVVYRGGERYVPRLVPSSVPTSKIFKVEPTGSYLITGGLGYLGLKVADWLVKQGVRHLTLLSRSGLTKETQAAVEALQQTGTYVKVLAADVADLTDMERVWKQLQAEEKPLKGIIHAAGVGRLDTLEELTPEKWEAVLRPKVQGGWNLHQLSRNENLDFFVCFSSIASVWGSRGQTHYAAANQFLDGLVHYRHSLGLPGLAINWGAWAGGGMTTNEAQRWLAQIGVEALSPELAISALEHLISANQVQVTVSRNDWYRFKTMYAVKRPRPLLDLIAVLPEDIEDKTNLAPSLLQQLEAVTETQRRELLRQALQEEVARVLGLPITNKPGSEVGFFEMGMDSLTAVDLRDRLSKLLGVNLSSTLTFDFPNIEKLEKYLINQHLVKVGLFTPETDQDQQEGDSLEANLLDEIKQSSNQELESSIDQILESIIN